MATRKRNAGASSKRKHKKMMKSAGISLAEIEYLHSLRKKRRKPVARKRKKNPDIFKAIGKKVIGIVQQGGKIVGIKVR